MEFELPVLILSNGVLLPESRVRVPVKSKANLAMLDQYVLNRSITSRTLVLVAYRTKKDKNIFHMGTVAVVEQVSCYSSNSFTQYTLHLFGISRAEIKNFASPVAKVEQVLTKGKLTSEKEKELIETVRAFELVFPIEDHRFVSSRLRELIIERNFEGIVDLVASLIPDIDYDTQLRFLETLQLEKETHMVIEWCKDYVKRHPPITSVRNSLEEQKEKALQRIRPIPNRKEDSRNDLDRLQSRIEALPDHVKERIIEDFNRIKSSRGNSQESSSMLQSYLEFIADLPWTTLTDDSIDIKRSREILHASHEGMQTVKQRILEYIAVRSLKNEKGQSLNGPILCFAGPPGVGKTTIAKAIAKSLGRKFERISLGGIRDEADIRGHRRTYIGAMPGRIMQALKHCKTRNPVILLDEVDKLYSGVHGSPSAALLEVLDPEQNNAFTDKNHSKSIIQDLTAETFDATEKREMHICPSSQVIFTLSNDNAHKVWLTGSFVDWKVLIEMQQDPKADNRWMVRLSLPNGHHQFRFVLDGCFHLEDKLGLECDKNGDLCHWVHLPLVKRKTVQVEEKKDTKKSKWFIPRT